MLQILAYFSALTTLAASSPAHGSTSAFWMAAVAFILSFALMVTEDQRQ